MGGFFEQNIGALSTRNPSLCARLRAADRGQNRYRLLESRSGKTIPAISGNSGAARPLHSTIDPEREAQRLISSLEDADNILAAGFLVLLGLGAGFIAEAALQRADVSGILIIDYDIAGVAELLACFDYTAVFSDPRVNVLIDPRPGEIVEIILAEYLPAVANGIRVLPLRARVDADPPCFNAAADAIQHAVDKISADYSVQAHFGVRWFSNIIRNAAAADTRETAAAVRINAQGTNPPEAAICAAGPSLDGQLPLLACRKKQNKDLFILAADTSLPALLARGLVPDAVVSIDCQHISYYHFLGTNCRDIPLFLDLASPPLLAGFSAAPVFMAGGHPLSRYISRYFKYFPALDTSGGNVTYACLSLAETLGARKIHVYGADFSYPRGRVYARGTYIYPYFERRQNRFATFESRLSSFLYRAPFLEPEETPPENKYYETAALRFYRKRFEEKVSAMTAETSVESGSGAPVTITRGAVIREAAAGGVSPELEAHAGKGIGAAAFLEQYRQKIEALPLPSRRPGSYPHNLSIDEKQILATALPLAAALKRRLPDLKTDELFSAVKKTCVEQIEKIAVR